MSISEVNSLLNELDNVNAELKRLKESIKKLQLTKKKIEENVSTYLQKTGEKGLKHGNKIVTIENKTFRKRGKKEDKEKKATEFLTSMGFKNPKNFYKKYNEAIQNETHETQIIKIKDKK